MTTIHMSGTTVISWPKAYFEKVKHLNGAERTIAAEWLKNESARVDKSDPPYSWNLWMAYLAALGGNIRFETLGGA